MVSTAAHPSLSQLLRSPTCRCPQGFSPCHALPVLVGFPLTPWWKFMGFCNFALVYLLKKAAWRGHQGLPQQERYLPTTWMCLQLPQCLDSWSLGRKFGGNISLHSPVQTGALGAFSWNHLSNEFILLCTWVGWRVWLVLERSSKELSYCPSAKYIKGPLRSKPQQEAFRLC